MRSEKDKGVEIDWVKECDEEEWSRWSGVGVMMSRRDEKKD